MDCSFSYEKLKELCQNPVTPLFAVSTPALITEKTCAADVCWNLSSFH